MDVFIPKATAESIVKHLEITQFAAVSAAQRAVAGEVLSLDECDEIVGALEANMESGPVEERDRLKALRDAVHDAIG